MLTEADPKAPSAAVAALDGERSRKIAARRGPRRSAWSGACGATAALLAVTFLAVLGVQSARIARERDRAAAAATRATTINHFLQEMLASAHPFEGLGRGVTVVQALEATVPKIGRAFADEPRLEAAARHDAMLPVGEPVDDGG